MTSTYKQCIATKLDGLQCTRGAENDCNYCWQHKTDDISEAISELNISDPQLAEILQYAGEYTTENKFAQVIINNENKKLKEWLIKIDVRTQWENIPTTTYEDLWNLYNNCNGGYPKDNYKYNSQLKSIFYSKQYTIHMNENLKNTIEEAENYIESINVDIVDKYVKTYMDTSKLRVGDTIWIQRHDQKYRNDDVVMWDGSKVLFLNVDVDDSGACNEFFDISTFPLVTYFKYTILHNSYVWLHNDVKIREVIKLNKIYKIIRDDDIVIYSLYKDFSETYLKNEYMIFTYDYDDFIKFIYRINSVVRWTMEEWEKDYKTTKITNPRILFDFQ